MFIIMQCIAISNTLLLCVDNLVKKFRQHVLIMENMAKESFS